MTVPCSGWEEQPRVPGAKMLHVEGTRMCSAMHCCHFQLSIPALSILWAGECSELPGAGCSAHGENTGWQHLLVLRSSSHHGDGCHCYSIALPCAPAEGRGASLAPRRPFPAIQRLRATHHWDGKISWGSDTYILILQQQQATMPAASSTETPVGETQWPMSMVQLRQNSSSNSQNHFVHVHKVPL